jgi:hypothetical protein
VKYLCMVFFDEKQRHALSDDEWRTFEAATHGCDDALRKRGHFTTAHGRNGRVSVTDGPFAETNEQIG